ncbi:MAG: hypothetical protein F6K36_14925 [Symploca sp. SIO3C6]|uniref:Uncharacterized protein n=1 Tax=Symploca sp. SIO1C4 TaxID=2607765 RepID=A0A6B3NBZ2_9CYAN|nr:hypothetical protein [Symploca sp. SIO3C6]NER31076.1 hypothetical protein [Symploca sp. SIO1C4]NET08409.1 hypothetical protein [Symploca sp. SIO2B6]
MYNQDCHEITTSLPEATALTHLYNDKTVTDNHPPLKPKIGRDWALNKVLEGG